MIAPGGMLAIVLATTLRVGVICESPPIALMAALLVTEMS